MITFKNNNTTSYSWRTRLNTFNSDITLAFAIDFNTAGEKATKKAATAQGKPYLGIIVNNEYSSDRVNKIVDKLNSIDEDSIRINIAGNGIYTMAKHGYTQEFCNILVLTYLHDIIHHPNLKKKIELIRSGGQTGFDEAAIHAAQTLNIPAIVSTTSDWKFRTADGKDIRDEAAFKKRFDLVK